MNEKTEKESQDKISGDGGPETNPSTVEEVTQLKEENGEDGTETSSEEETRDESEQRVGSVKEQAQVKPEDEAPNEHLKLSDLEKKRELLNREAEKHKWRRNKLNDQTREWVERRDALNAKVREIIEQANIHRERRDKLNGEVKQLKAERDAWNSKVGELTEKLAKVRRKNLPKGKVPLGKLRREKRELEFKQQTTVLSPEKERELIELLSRIESEIRTREKELEENEEVKAVTRELEEARRKAEEFHRRVGEVADEAQVEHDKMTELYMESDRTRKEADRAQEEFIRTKMMADEEHKKHIDYIRKVHDLDKIISGMRFKQRMARVRTDEKVAMREAEDIYERFKKGDKLSTEDLMTLQKSGYL